MTSSQVVTFDIFASFTFFFDGLFEDISIHPKYETSYHGRKNWPHPASLEIWQYKMAADQEQDRWPT